MNQKNKKTNNNSIFRRNVKTLSLTFYDEQLKINYKQLVDRVQNTPSDKAEVVMIVHDKEEKKHYHLGVRLMGPTQKNGRHIKSILNIFGIEYRIPEDVKLLENKAVDTIKDYQAFLLYLMHKTGKAMAEGKEQYDIEDIVTNIPSDRLQVYIEGYAKRNYDTNKTLEELDELAYEYGYKLKDFDQLLQTYPLNIRGHGKIRVIKETYQRGIDKRIKEDNTIVRTCIFIQGAKDLGKTYSSSIALRKMGYQDVLRPSGGKTGMFDDLKCTTEAIIIDDDKLDNALNILDNKICKVYRRNSNNPVFTGDMVIITSNYSYDDWASRCGYAEREIEAIRSRLYVTYVHNDKLICISPSKRGTEEEQMLRKEKYIEFKRYFTESIESYHKIGKIDYSDIND